MSQALRIQTIYAYILHCREQDQLHPTLREISSACNIPLKAVFNHLNWLQDRGYISRDNTVRSIRPLKPLPTDEELVYNCLVHAIKVSGFSPSLKAVCQSCRLSPARVKDALDTLVQAGRIQPYPDDPRLFYPVEIDQKS